MKILVLSLETWRDGTNGGNVLTNMFSDIDAEFAQIYCSSGTPSNKICNRYFQMTDAMAIRNILQKRPMGRIIEKSETDVTNVEEIDQTINKVKRFGSHDSLRVAREIVWALSDYKNEELKSFVINFDPDVIFAPHYGVTYMLSLTEYVWELTHKPIISYISDDSYSLKNVNFSPFFWINRFVIRHKTRSVWKNYKLIYTMTETQKNYMSKLGKPMKILMKSASFGEIPQKITVGNPIKIVYAGGIYLNRWKTLSKLVDAIKEINQDSVKFILDIYTGNECKKEIADKLNDGVNVFLHPAISQEKLKLIYHNSDIALHVESFDLKNRLAVRMSFSTKIVDCLSSGCAVMAICDEKQGGMVYLRENNAAICISDKTEIINVLMRIIKNPNIILNYIQKASNLCRRNHDSQVIHQMIKKDFEEIVGLQN